MKRTSFIKKLLTIVGIASIAPIVIPVITDRDKKTARQLLENWKKGDVNPDDWVNVAFANGEWITIGKSGSLMKSTDKINWTKA